MHTILLLLLAVVTGMLLPIQPGINSVLRHALGSAWLAALISFLVGTLMLLTVVIAIRFTHNPRVVPSMELVRSAPWWAWLGGLIGAVFVVGSIVLAPKLGAVLFVGAVVFGQMFSSILLDHFGVSGFRQQPMTPGRVAGTALILVGIMLILKSSPRVEPDGEEGASSAVSPVAIVR